MAAVIVNASKDNGLKFLSQLGLFRRTNENGAASLSSSHEVALEVAEAYSKWLEKTGKERNAESLEVFYKDICKLRMAKDGNVVVGGYMILNGHLKSVFSFRKGMGTWLVRQAMNDGAMYLDCFDGFLVDFYKSLGWSTLSRERNWTPGGPDVVYMHRVVAP